SAQAAAEAAAFVLCARQGALSGGFKSHPSPARGTASRTARVFIVMNEASAQRVPSLSNVAIRSGTSTKSAEPGVEIFSTKETIDFFATPSFQEVKGSSA